MTILVGYDGSDGARRALRHAADLVGRGGSVTVLNVIPTQGVSSRIEAASDSQLDRQSDLLREARTVLAEQKVEMKALASVGDPTSEIRIAAEKTGARIVVVGRSSGVRRLIKGSVSTRLVRRAPCDVLVVN